MTDGATIAPMAKTQKTFLLNDELVRLIDAYQKRTGANFTRTVTAALLQYLFQDPEGPNPLWMEYAVGLELGEHTVGDMPQKRHDDAALEFDDLPDGRIGPDGKVSEIPQEYVDYVQRWERLLNRKHDDPITKLIKHWSEAPRSALSSGWPEPTDE